MRRVLVGLLLADFAFIIANVAAMGLALSPKLQAAIPIDLGLFMTPAFSVNADQGLPEILDYAKTAITIALLYLCARRHAQPIYLAVAAVFLIILLDDVLMIHESVGTYLVERYNLHDAFGLRGQDFGELSVYAVWLIAAGALGLYGLVGSGAAHIRMAVLFGVVIGLIAFFSVLIDMLEIELFWDFRRVALMIGVVEDSGEMIGMTMALIVALALWRHPSLVEPPERS